MFGFAAGCSQNSAGAENTNNCSYCAAASSSSGFGAAPRSALLNQLAPRPESRTNVRVSSRPVAAHRVPAARRQVAAALYPEQLFVCTAARTRGIPNPNNFIASSRHKKRPDPEGAGPKPEQIVQPAPRNPDSRSPKSSPPRPHGVFWALLVFFAIFCYLDHIIRLWCNVLHPTLCHTLKLGKFFKHLLPIHLRYILMHNVAFVYQ